MILEIACFNDASCKNAHHLGANRIELCEDYTSGGITPSLQLARTCLKKTSCEVYAMIRPRSGDFIYSDTEFLLMKKQISEMKDLGVKGFVFGILDDHLKVNIEQNKALIQLCAPLPCTFHRAFDLITDKAEALEALIHCGFKRILTSGGAGNAINNTTALKDLQKQSGHRISIIAGGGVRSGNLTELIKQTGIKEFHSAAIVDPNTQTADPNEIELLRTILDRT